MNILVVGDHFDKGGFETHLLTNHNLLNKRNKMVYCFGYKSEVHELKDSIVYDNFNFSADVDLEQLIFQIERLSEIIKKENINVIHIHPYYCLFPTALAASLNNIPVVYSYHGFGSFNFGNNLSNNYLLLFKYIFNNIINLVFSVSAYGISAFNKGFGNRVELLPNGIDFDIYKPNRIVNNKKWALISRLDIDKYGEIEKLLKMLPKLDINHIDIYGSGSEEFRLKTYVQDNKLSRKVSFMGYNNNLSDELNGKYNGIIGVGRVVLEGLAMEYPILLIEYSKVVGILTQEKYFHFKDLNFVDKNYEDITIEQLNKELKQVYKNKNIDFYETFKQEFDNEKLMEKYIDIISSLSPRYNSEIKDFYKYIKNSIIKTESLKYSSVLYNGIKSRLLSNNLDLSIMEDLYNVESFNVSNYCLNRITEINNKIIELETKIASLEKKINEKNNQIADLEKENNND